MKKILALITLIIFLSSTFIFAQQRKQPPIWDIRAMAVGNGVVNLTIDGSTYASIPRSDAKIIIDILDRISAHSGIYPEKINLVGQNMLNASAGYINGVATINIYKPMFDIFIKDRDLAAFVLGHEMGHLYFRHGENAKSIQAAGELVALIAGSVLSAKTGKKYGNPQLGADVGNLLGTAVATSFTRDQERESDKIGLEWMIKNGYNPEGAIRLFTAFQRMGGNSPIPFFQTHPNPGERMDNVKALVDAYYTPKNTTVQTTTVSKEIKQETTITKAVSPVAISDEITKLNTLIDEEKLNQYPKTENGRIAVTALAKKDYAQAKIYFEKCSVEGEAMCINNLGVLYQTGLGVPIDKKKSAELYKQDSDKGLPIAMTNYASSLARGDESGFRESSKTVGLYIAAAEKGSPKAMGLVAYISQFKGGFGANQIPTTDTLVNYAKVSAMRGFSEGQMALGSFYRKGFGLSQDFELAETNLLLAAKSNKTVIADLFLLYNEDKKISDKAEYYKNKIINEKNSTAATVLVNFYCVTNLGDRISNIISSGSRVSTDCINWGEIGAINGSVLSARIYGYYLYKGIGTKANKSEGFAWLISATKRGDKAAIELFEKNKSDLTLDELNTAEQRSKEILSKFFKS